MHLCSLECKKKTTLEHHSRNLDQIKMTVPKKDIKIGFRAILHIRKKTKTTKYLELCLYLHKASRNKKKSGFARHLARKLGR